MAMTTEIASTSSRPPADITILGASGTAGQLIAQLLLRDGASVVLAGRNQERSAALRDRFASSAVVGTLQVDLADPASVRAAAAAGRVLINTVGPFTRLAPPVIDACLEAGSRYVDLANERAAVRAVFDRDAEARRRGVPLVTGAGFGLTATEALVIALLESGETPVAVRVAAAAGSAHATDGVRATVAEGMADGATTYVGGELRRAPIGSGVTELTFAGATYAMMPAPTGELEAARRLTGAADVTAYALARPRGHDLTSRAYAELTDAAGRVRTAELSTGEGFAFTAAVAATTATRLLSTSAVGAWSPCHLFGTDIVTGVPGTSITTETVGGLR